MSAVKCWEHKSLSAELIGVILHMETEEARPLPSCQERQTVLTDIASALQRLQLFLERIQADYQWMEKLFDYIQTLLSLPSAQTPV